MPMCLEAEYDSVIRTLLSYGAYTATIRKRINVRVLALDSGVSAWKELLEQWGRDLSPFAPSTTPAMRKLIQRFANKDEQSSPFYDVMLSDYPLETLALQIEAAHPDLNFAQIAKLHESRDKRLWWANPSVLIAGILGIGLFFLNTVPDAFLNTLWRIESPSGIKFAQLFDVFVFLITFISVILGCSFWLFYWFKIGRWMRAVQNTVRGALDYLVARQARSIAQPDATVDRP